MMDGRRSQWIAFDALFFGSTTCDRLLDEFGPAGVTVWLAYLCACKRNLVPGQISVLSDADTLAQLGIPGLPLVNSEGDEWALDALWTQLGRAKNVSRRRRGRVTDIVCTRWGHWQKDMQRDQRAEKKRRSRQENTGTLDGRSGDDSATDKTATRDRQRQETDPYVDTSSETHTPSGDDVCPAVAAAIEIEVGKRYDDRVAALHAAGKRVGNPASYIVPIRDTVHRECSPTFIRIAAEQPDAGPQWIIDEYLRRTDYGGVA